MVVPVLRRVGFPLRIAFDWRDPRVKRVLMLMLPVTLEPRRHQRQPGHQLEHRHARRRGRAARDRRRLPHLHAAAGDVLRGGRDRAVPAARAAWPRASDLPGLRRWSGDGMRLIFLALIPCAAADARARRADHPARLRARRVRRRRDRATVRRRCSGSPSACPFAGANLLLTRTFFASSGRGCRPRWPAASAASSTPSSRLALYGPLGIAGIVPAPRSSSLRHDRAAGLLPAPRAAAASRSCARCAAWRR